MMKQLGRIVKVGLLVAMLAGCQHFDQHYDSKFQNVAIGASLGEALQGMGQPSGESFLELPLVSVRQLVWKSPGGDVYTMNIVQNTVITKSVIR